MDEAKDENQKRKNGAAAGERTEYTDGLTAKKFQSTGKRSASVLQGMERMTDQSRRSLQVTGASKVRQVLALGDKYLWYCREIFLSLLSQS